MSEDPTVRALRLVREEWTKPYREAISTALAELDGCKRAEYDVWERECYDAAVDVLAAALNPPASRERQADA